MRQGLGAGEAEIMNSCGEGQQNKRGAVVKGSRAKELWWRAAEQKLRWRAAEQEQSRRVAVKGNSKQSLHRQAENTRRLN